MNQFDLSRFDIDVDVAPLLLDNPREPILVSGRWYKLLRPHNDRPPYLQAQIEEGFQRTLHGAQWEAAQQRFERRQAGRAPLLSRVHVDGSLPFVACDISRLGLRASGRPQKDLIDVEFKVPGLQFPVDARVEVVSFKDSNVIPLAGLRFVDIDTPYLEHIERYVQKRQLERRAA